MFTLPSHVPRLMPWPDWKEWKQCKQHIIQAQRHTHQQQHTHHIHTHNTTQPPSFTTERQAACLLALTTIEAWRARGRVPLSIEATAQLLHIQQQDQQLHTSSSLPASAADVLSLRLQYSMSLLRFVNGLLDPVQTKQHAQSINMLAVQLHLPRVLVDVRHEATHNELPSLAVLRYAAQQALMWMRTEYWEAQDALINRADKDMEDILNTYHSIIISNTHNDDNNHVSNNHNSSTSGMPAAALQTLKKLTAVDPNSQLVRSLLLSALFEHPVRCLQQQPTDLACTPKHVETVFARLSAVWSPVLQFMCKKQTRMFPHLVTYLVKRLAKEGNEQHASHPQPSTTLWRLSLLSQWTRHILDTQPSEVYSQQSTFIQSLVEICNIANNPWTHSVLTSLVTMLNKASHISEHTHSLLSTVHSIETRTLSEPKHDDGNSSVLSSAASLHIVDVAAITQPSIMDELRQNHVPVGGRIVDNTAVSTPSSPDITLAELQAFCLTRQHVASSHQSVPSTASDASITIKSRFVYCPTWPVCSIGVMHNEDTPDLLLTDRSEHEADIHSMQPDESPNEQQSERHQASEDDGEQESAEDLTMTTETVATHAADGSVPSLSAHSWHIPADLAALLHPVQQSIHAL